MAVIWAGIIAVVGSLADVVISYQLQENTSKRNEATARAERLRQERLAAYSAFAGAVMDLRRTEYDRAYSRMPPEGGRVDRSGIRAESSRLRSVAWTAFYRFKLTSPDEDLTALALRAIEEAFDAADASDRADLKNRSELARARIDAFISAAATQVDAGTQSRPQPRRWAYDLVLGDAGKPN